MLTKPAEKKQGISFGKGFLLFGIFILITFASKAQYFSDTLYYRVPKSPPKAIVKMDLLSPFRRYKGISLSFEHQLKPTLYLEHQIDYLTNLEGSSLGPNSIDDKYSGFQFHSELRYYMDFKVFSQRGIYIAPKISFGHVIREKEQTLRLDCGSGCEYFKRVNYDLRENLGGVLFKFGMQRIYKETIVMDYYFGAGYQTHAFKIKGLRESEKEVLLRRNSSESENNTAAVFSFGFKVGFVLK